MIVGLDIGGHHVAGALLNRQGHGILVKSYRHSETRSGAASAELLDAWANLITTIAPDTDQVTGVGIAMPGPFDYRTGTAFFEGNGKFESLYGINVRDEVQRRLPVSREIRFLNDATAFAVGCAAMGATGSCTRVLAITLGTGLGAAFLDSGIPVIEEEPGVVPPGGCLWNLPFKHGIADDYVSSRWLLTEGARQSGRPQENVARMAADARQNEVVREVFAEYGANLAAIVAPWARGFGAETIMLGGRIAGAFDLFAPTLRQGLAACDMAIPILIHENTEDAAIVGAGQMFTPAFWAEARTRLPRR